MDNSLFSGHKKPIKMGKKGNFDMAKLTDVLVSVLIGIFLVAILSAALSPLILDSFDNLSTVAPTTIATLFGSTGVLAILLFIGFFTAILFLITFLGKKGMK